VTARTRIFELGCVFLPSCRGHYDFIKFGGALEPPSNWDLLFVQQCECYDLQQSPPTAVTHWETDAYPKTSGKRRQRP
jgi:hypothetical protein